jgi:hypothetical protein
VPDPLGYGAVAAGEGFEPPRVSPTFAFQASLITTRATSQFGRPDRTRTGDFYRVEVALFQLSYGPKDFGGSRRTRTSNTLPCYPLSGRAPHPAGLLPQRGVVGGTGLEPATLGL